jgi:hypothetical protein
VTPAARSSERDRFERFKAKAPGADPRVTFAQQAAAEAEQRRQRALDSVVRAAPHRVEQEMTEDGAREHAYLLDRLAALGAWIGSGCFPEEPDLALQDDWIRHRQLTRADFLETDPQDSPLAVEMGDDARVAAYVAIALSCVIEVDLRHVSEDRYEAELEAVRYFAMLSRNDSWWNPETATDADWVLRHEQLHFDVAELIAEELGRETEGLRRELRGVGTDPASALADFKRIWTQRMERVQASFDEIEERYDRETRHGTDLERQTEWFALVRRGLGAVRAGLPEAPVLVR